MVDQPNPTIRAAIPGRGATTNVSGRFERLEYYLDPEAEPEAPDPDFPAPSPKTIFLKDASRTILTKQNSPDIPMEWTVNPYRGCEHGCIYCYARPTHEYFGFSPGLDFETRILVKEKAPILLREALMSKSWKAECISFSGVTDCYQPIERKLKLTRACLEVLAEFQNPFTLITKNHLVTRDIDVIAPMAKLHAAAVFITITSLDPELCGILEPRTSRPAFRLQAIRELTQAGIPVGVMIAPVIPGLTDSEIPAILREAARAGAKHAGHVVLRLPYGVKDLFSEWLGQHRPERASRVLGLIKDVRGGKLNDSSFGSRMSGQGAYAKQIHDSFRIFAKREGLNQLELRLSSDSFQRPGEQLRLI